MFLASHGRSLYCEYIDKIYVEAAPNIANPSLHFFFFTDNNNSECRL